MPLNKGEEKHGSFLFYLTRDLSASASQKTQTLYNQKVCNCWVDKDQGEALIACEEPAILRGEEKKNSTKYKSLLRILSWS